MSCGPVEELLQAHVDGELTPQEVAQVDAHLPGCAACQQARTDLVALAGQLRGMFAARERVDVPVSVPGVPALTAPAGAAAAAPAAPAAPGTARLKAVGGYRIDGEIARGGMGTVYRATQLSMDRPVALKVLAPKLAESEEFVARFLREARVAAGLTHPNVITIYDVGRDGDRLYYSMELIEGEDAEAVLKRDGFMPPRRAAEVAAGVARALVAAADRGIVHRDIKPANVLLTKDGGVKLADLGLAKEVDDPKDSSLTQGKRVIGSPNYMSPEQASDLRQCTHRSDVYSLGATLLHLVSGQTPFGGGSPIEVIARVLRDPPALPERLPGGEALDDALRAVLERTLEKDPAARYPSARELLADLEAFIAGEAPAFAKPARTSRRLQKKSDSGRVARTRGSSDAHRVLPGGRRSDVGRTSSPVGPILAIAAALAVVAGLAVVMGGGGRPPEQVAPLPKPPAPKPSRPTVSQQAAQQQQQAPQNPAPQGPAQPDQGESAARDLELWMAQAPRAPGETWRRAGEVLDELAGKPAPRVHELRESARKELETVWAEVGARGRQLEAGERWWEALEAYRGHLAAQGQDAPTGLDAQVAIKALEAQIAVRLEGDLRDLEVALARGDGAKATALAATIRGYGGPEAEAKARARIDQTPGGVLAEKPKAPEPKPVVEPKPAEEDKAAARERRVKAALAEAKRKLEQGDLAGAQATLDATKDDLAHLPGLATEAEKLTAQVAAARAKPEAAPAALLAAYLRAPVAAKDEGRLQVSYQFDAAAEGEDWEAAPSRNAAEKWLEDQLKNPPAPQGVSGQPWSVQRKMLVGWGWGRRRHSVAWRTDRPLTIEVETRGGQNVLIGFASTNGDAVRTTLVGFGYMLEELPIQKFMQQVGRMEGVKDKLNKLAQTVQQSRGRGPALVVLKETDAALNFEEVHAKPHPAMSKTEFTIELTPGEGGTAIAVKVGKRVVAEATVELPEQVRLTLQPFGAAVAYDRLIVTGAPDQGLLDRLREASRTAGAEPDALRRRVGELREEEKKREQEKAWREAERERREREERERREREKREGEGKDGKGEGEGKDGKGEGEGKDKPEPKPEGGKREGGKDRPAPPR